jgi:hypothetical protein
MISYNCVLCTYMYLYSCYETIEKRRLVGTNLTDSVPKNILGILLTMYICDLVKKNQLISQSKFR